MAAVWMGGGWRRPPPRWRRSGHPPGALDRLEIQGQHRERPENSIQVLAFLAIAHAGVELGDADPESEVIGMAVIKAYEFTFELSWKTLKDLLSHEGLDVLLPREVLRQAFAAGLLRNGQVWIDMLEQRNLMAHTYDVKRARLALALIRDHFAPSLEELVTDLEQR